MAEAGKHIDMITDEKMQEALALIAKGVTRPTKIAKALGMTYRAYCKWMVRSNAGDPQFLIEYNGEEIQFAKAITLATRLALLELRGMATMETIFGVEEVQVFQGQVVWAMDAEACKYDEDTREMLGFRRDGLLERDGKLVPFTVTKPAPWAQRQRLLEAAFADLRPSQTINQNVNVNGQVGVGFAKPVDYSRGPPPVPAPPPMPMIEAPITDADFNEVDDLDDLLGPEPQPVAPISVNISVETVQPAPQTERVIRDTPTAGETPPKQEGILASPRAYDATPARPARSPLEQNLFDELEKARARKAAL
jgi:hypothetical protein